ncbi:MAG: hypothetical protein DSY90_14155 [Deltaproteobacteria bacterium]|nr:MAG: hypothetical protein DSY90_14155 [Deltaproteobacteria bacterium]
MHSKSSAAGCVRLNILCSTGTCTSINQVILHIYIFTKPYETVQPVFVERRACLVSASGVSASFFL